MSYSIAFKRNFSPGSEPCVELDVKPLLSALHSGDEVTSDECGTVGGMRIDRRKRSIWRIPDLVWLVHHKSHTT
jgi:hypothetical protein